jgi:hypothetical protein
MLKNKALALAMILAALPAAAQANSATTQSIVSMTLAGVSCTVTSDTNPSFGTLTNPITTLESTTGQLDLTCGNANTAVKLAFNDTSNSGTYNFTMTNSTTTSATQTFQICDNTEFTGTTCPNGYEYKNTTADQHALPTGAGNSYYNYDVYFAPAAGGSINLTSGTYFDTLTETITF